MTIVKMTILCSLRLGQSFTVIIVYVDDEMTFLSLAGTLWGFVLSNSFWISSLKSRI